MFATVLIILGVMTLLLPLRELYIYYQAPLDERVFIMKVAQFLSNKAFVIGESGNTIVSIDEVAKNVAFFLFFLFMVLFILAGISFLKAGVNTLPRTSRKYTKMQIRQSLSKI